MFLITSRGKCSAHFSLANKHTVKNLIFVGSLAQLTVDKLILIGSSVHTGYSCMISIIQCIVS